MITKFRQYDHEETLIKLTLFWKLLVTSSLQDHVAFIEHYNLYISTVTKSMTTKFEKQVNPENREVDSLETNKVGISDTIPLKSRDFEKMSNSFLTRVWSQNLDKKISKRHKLS